MKKQQKRRLKRNLLFGCMLFIAIFTVFLSTTANTTTDRNKTSSTNETSYLESFPSQAGYAKSIKIDALRLESAYDCIIDDPDYEIWYANNASWHFIFMNSTTNLTGKSILVYTDDFNYSLTPETVQTSFLSAYHVNYSLEFRIARVLTGSLGEETNDFNLLIDDTQIIPLHVGPVTPSSEGSTIIPLVEKEEGETKIIRASWIDDLSNAYKKDPLLALFHGIIIGFVLGILGFGAKYYAVRLREYPVVFVINCVSEEDWLEVLPKLPKSHIIEDEEFNIKHDMIKLGRFRFEEGTSKSTNKHKLRFNSVPPVHCDEHFAQVYSSSRKRRVNIYQSELVDYQVMIFNIPLEKQPNKEVLKKGAKNKLRFFFAKHMFIRSISLRLYDHVEYEETEVKLKKVLYLIHRDGKERLKYVADFKYKQHVADEKDPEKYEWKEEKAKPLYHREFLEKNPTIKKNTIRYYHLREKIIEVGPELRDSYRESEDNLRIQMIQDKDKYLREIKEKNKYILELENKEVLLKEKLELDYARKSIELRNTKLETIERYSKKFLPHYAESGNFDEARKEGLKELERSKEYQNLKELQMQYKIKLQKLDNPALIEELMASNKAKDKIIQMYINGNGKKKSEIDTLEEELNNIMKSSEEE